MPKRIDLKGKTFGYLRVLALQGRDPASNQALWKCRCRCGNYVAVLSRSLRNGNTRSCGCLRKEVASAVQYKHGHFINKKQSPEYRTWRAMLDRCRLPNHISYKYYGAIGVRVCTRWQRSFMAFYRDMGPKPSSRHSLDRFPDNAGNYEPNNCRWATARQQRLNQRANSRNSRA